MFWVQNRGPPAFRDTVLSTWGAVRDPHFGRRLHRLRRQGLRSSKPGSIDGGSWQRTELGVEGEQVVFVRFVLK